MGRKDPAGGYEDWIANITQEEDIILICDECRSYIRNEVYWEINGEILCDDCAKAKYQRGVSGEYYEY